MSMTEKKLDQSINDLNDLFVRLLNRHSASHAEAVAILTAFAIVGLDTVQKCNDLTNHDSNQNNKYVVKCLQEHMLSKN